ncbi:MAG: thioredoxin family protein [Roseiflexaceae bacterium]|nr:thioredoxin family protein [Roseiflexaceae bacterium]
MALIDPKNATAVRQELDAALTRPVTLVLFTTNDACAYCDVTRELLLELVALHPRLQLRTYDLNTDATYAATLAVDKAPAMVILGGVQEIDYGIRYYGLPSGYEFATLLEAIRIVGTDQAALQPATQAFLATLTQPLHLQVFVTPSCPYCPRAAVLAYALAHASPHITADTVEVSEFPELGERYHVMGVPRTVIAEAISVEGAVPEGMLLSKLSAALQAAAAN